MAKRYLPPTGEASQRVNIGLLLPFILFVAFLGRRYFAKTGDRALLAKVKERRKLEELMSPPIIKKNSTSKSYKTSITAYPSIYTFYHAHPMESKLPLDSKFLPLLVFVHGLGGNMAQFAPLLSSLTNVAPCLSIDFPGCGLSKFEPDSYDAYTTDAFVELLVTAIVEQAKQDVKRPIILIGHSYGCSISAKLAVHAKDLDIEVLGVVAICPKSSPPTESEMKGYEKILSLPDFMVDGLRWFDRRGGLSSVSVTRMTGKDGGVDLKKIQQRYNEAFKTTVWKRTARGGYPKYINGVAHGGYPGRETWSQLHVPLLLIAGAADTVTKPEEVNQIVSFLQHTKPEDNERKKGSVAMPAAFSVGMEKPSNLSSASQAHADDTSYGIIPSTMETISHNSAMIRTAVLPSPAAHALLYDHATYRTVAGLIEDFISKHISPHLSLGWQLQQLTTTGKWDVKNLAKWQGVIPVSEPIAGGIFRALKTLREQDEVHTPNVFVEKWGGEIYALIDISHDSPIYDPKVLNQGGVHYHKFPTVSKVPPTPSEVADFIALVDRLRKEISEEGKEPSKAVGVHCHYGYNRTGFFIVCYLVEKEGWTVQGAIDEFAKKRAPGIRHDHFIDTLFVRYCAGLKRAPTMRPGEAEESSE